jgi:hypothetical protein
MLASMETLTYVGISMRRVRQRAEKTAAKRRRTMLPVTTTSSGNTYCHYNFKRKEAQVMVATANRHS